MDMFLRAIMRLIYIFRNPFNPFQRSSELVFEVILNIILLLLSLHHLFMFAIDLLFKNIGLLYQRFFFHFDQISVLIVESVIVVFIAPRFVDVIQTKVCVTFILSESFVNLLLFDDQEFTERFNVLDRLLPKYFFGN